MTFCSTLFFNSLFAQLYFSMPTNVADKCNRFLAKGQWTEWSAWSGCSVVCGATGTQNRERICRNPTTSATQEDCATEGNPGFELRVCSNQCSKFCIC